MSDTDVDTTDTTDEPTSGPEPVLRGRFSIYETAQGGYHLVWRADGEEVNQHADIPPMIVKLARKGGMNPMDALRALSGMR